MNLLRPSFVVVLLLLGSVACEELKHDLPTTPPPPALPSFSKFQVVGHWEASSDQGRRIAFDVTEDGLVVNGRLNFHHECNVGRWRATLDGFTAKITDDGFLTTADWRASGNGSILAGMTLSGTYTISGRFEADGIVRGSLISAVTDVRDNEQPTGVVCQSIHTPYDGEKDP